MQVNNRTIYYFSRFLFTLVKLHAAVLNPHQCATAEQAKRLLKHCDDELETFSDHTLKSDD